jgi:hypothetical protein
MHAKPLLVGVLAASSVVAAQEPHLMRRDDSATPVDPTMTRHHPKQSWETEDPAKASQYRADMKSLQSSIHVSDKLQSTPLHPLIIPGKSNVYIYERGSQDCHSPNL